MARHIGSERRESTIFRDKIVHQVHESIKKELGKLYPVVSKSYIYERIQKETGLCTKTIAFILNHTRDNLSQTEE